MLNLSLNSEISDDFLDLHETARILPTSKLSTVFGHDGRPYTAPERKTKARLEEFVEGMKRQITPEVNKIKEIFCFEMQKSFEINMKLKKKQGNIHSKSRICVDWCGYKLVKDISKRFGMVLVDINSDWDILWSDMCITTDRHKNMKRFQRCNHFPEIIELCRKNHLAKNLQLLNKEFPEECNFFPPTWVLPQEKYKVLEYLRGGKRTVIVKPDNGSNGQGIYLVRNAKHLDTDKYKTYICQGYISNPYLIDGFKFDMRIYVLMTSCDPLRIYIHSEGLARFATVQYKAPHLKNINNKFMHLTNYAVNKDSMSFINDDEIGSKRKISTINEWMRRYQCDVDKVWANIDDVIIKTILSTLPSLKSSYNSVFNRQNQHTACFQLLGFDIILDDNLNPYVLEVNHAPSLHTNTQLDLEIKTKVIEDSFNLCNVTRTVRRKVLRQDKQEIQNRLLKHLPGRNNVELRDKKDFKQEQVAWEESHMGGYRLLYPRESNSKYDNICNAMDAVSHYKDTYASQVRCMYGRAQRKNLAKKYNPATNGLKKKVAAKHALRKKNLVKNPESCVEGVKKIIKRKQQKRFSTALTQSPEDVMNRKDKITTQHAKVVTPTEVFFFEKEKMPTNVTTISSCIPLSKNKDEITIQDAKAIAPTKDFHLNVKTLPTNLSTVPMNIQPPKKLSQKKAMVVPALSAATTPDLLKEPNTIVKLTAGLPTKLPPKKPSQKKTMVLSAQSATTTPDHLKDPETPMKLVAEWTERKLLISKMNVSRLIFQAFMKNDNLSATDLRKYKHYIKNYSSDRG